MSRGKIDDVMLLRSSFTQGVWHYCTSHVGAVTELPALLLKDVGVCGRTMYITISDCSLDEIIGVTCCSVLDLVDFTGVYALWEQER